MIRFSVALPTFGWPGAALFRTPGVTHADFGLCRRVALDAERLGFHGIWVPDHLMIGYDEAVLDGWTVLAALAGQTDRVQLALMMQSPLFRLPQIQAKATATLAMIAPGRVVFSLSKGLKQAEHQAYGIAFPDEAARGDRMEEAVELIRRLWTEALPVTHDGPCFSLAGAVCHPLPDTEIPMILHGGSEADLERIARLRTGWISPPLTLADLGSRAAFLADARRQAGDPHGTYPMVMERQILIAPDLAGVRSVLARLLQQPSGAEANGRRGVIDSDLNDFINDDTMPVPPRLAEQWLIGTPDQVAMQIDALAREGVNELILWFLDLPGSAGMDLFARTMAKAFTRGEHVT